MITLHIDGAVATATLSRPPVNAINDEWLERLDAILDEVSAASGVSVLWIRSDQRVFCAGADLALMKSRFDTEQGRADMVEFIRRIQRVYARLEAAPLVCIAEIGGSAMGGGFELALACDLRVAAREVKMGLPEVALGLLPGAGGTQRMTRIAGDAVSRRLILGAEVVDGATAERLGLVQWSAPAAEVQATTRAIVERFARLPIAAIARSKACIGAALAPDANGFEVEVQGSAVLLADDVTQGLVRAFFAKSGGK